MTPTPRALLWLFAALACSASLHAAPLTVGSPLPSMTLEDPHGAPYAVSPQTQLLVFSAEKATSAMVNALFSAEHARLPTPRALHVADISAMPGVVTRLFALPKLRELPFTVALAYQASSVADLPRQAGAATVLRLDDGRVSAVGYARDASALSSLLGLPR